MAYQSSRKKKYVNGSNFEDFDSDDMPELSFESIFLKNFYSYTMNRQFCSRFDFAESFCSVCFDALQSCLNMLIPYLYDIGDTYPNGQLKKPDVILIPKNKSHVEKNLVQFINSELLDLRQDIFKLSNSKKGRIEFMQRLDFIYSIIPRYFNRMGLGLTQLVIADSRYSRDDK
jgi:hypothetical protein